MRLIDADTLKTKLVKVFIDKFEGSAFDAIDLLENTIDDAPTVTTNRGRWIKVEDDYNNHLYECSNCHTWTSLPTEEVNDGNIRYCWSCGARMDGVTDGKIH